MMQTMCLSKSDIEFSNNEFEEVNERKSYLQDLIITRLLKRQEGLLPPTKVVACCFTRFGKTYLAKRFLERFKLKFPEFKNYVVVPSIHLKKEWENLGIFDGVFVVNSFTMNEVKADKDNVGVVVYDECHHYSNKQSSFFSTAFDILNSKYSLALSATLDFKHLEYMASRGFSRVFKLTLDNGKQLGIIPEFSVKNVPVSLTKKEKKDYIELQEDIIRLIKPFFKIENDIIKIEQLLYAVLAPVGETRLYDGVRKTSEQHCEWIMARFEEAKVNIKSAGSIISLADKITTIKYRQKSIVQNSENKIATTIEFCKKLKGERILIFCSTTVTADKLALKLRKEGVSAVSFHSKMSTKDIGETLDKFYAGVIDVLISIGKIKEGFTVKDVKYGLRMSYTGSKIDATQITGRILSFNEEDENKESLLVNLYVDSFIYNDEEIPSIEVQALENAYKGFDIDWVADLDSVFEETQTLL